MVVGMVFLLNSAFVGLEEQATVKIDGQEVVPKGVLRFKKDDAVHLEATGLQAHSDIEIKVKKAGITWVNHVFRVGKEGEVVGIIHTPNKKLKVTCFVKYLGADGSPNEVKFKLQTY